jgi:hypothetical protein
MTATHIIAARHQQSLAELSEILAKHDPEAAERVAKANHGPSHGMPSPTKKPLETAAYHAECLLALAKIVDEQLGPRRRGRPRKAS